MVWLLFSSKSLDGTTYRCALERIVCLFLCSSTVLFYILLATKSLTFLEESTAITHWLLGSLKQLGFVAGETKHGSECLVNMLPGNILKCLQINLSRSHSVLGVNAQHFGQLFLFIGLLIVLSLSIICHRGTILICLFECLSNRVCLWASSRWFWPLHIALDYFGTPRFVGSRLVGSYYD